MPKYIDLLRSHQKSKQTPTAESPKAQEILVDEQPEQARLGSPPPKKTPSQDLSSKLFTEEEQKVTVHPHSMPPQGLEHALSDEQTWPDTPEKAGSGISGSAIRWLKTCVQLTLHMFQAAASGKPAGIEALSKHTRLLIQALMKKADGLHGLELQVANHDHDIRNVDFDLGSLIAKSITLMLYAIKMGLRMHLSEDELHTLVLSAMLHHIGMAQVPTSIRHKKGVLSSQEREYIKKAPSLGEAYLRACGIENTDILETVTHAHERHDGSGPLGLAGNQINHIARIVGLLSVFEALIAFRPYRNRLLPRDAIRELIKQHKEEFNHDILKMLIESISLYPVGSFVQLNSGDVGQIIAVHDRLPLRPKVRLNMDRHGNHIVPRIVDLQAQPNLRVSRCMYREELAELKNQPAE